MIKEACFYEKKEDGKVICNLCPHHCSVLPGKYGLCKARVNKEGKLYTENYGMISSLAMDPIEKKPLYHFYPGTRILSIGTFGCNFTCDYCQNWQISQEKPLLKELLPAELVEIAIDKGSKGIAYTYSEPTIWFEFIKETAEIAKKQGLKNIFISNGYINSKVLEELLPYLDGANIDLKAFNKDFYRKLCSGRLEPVLENIELMAKNNLHLELTTLIIRDYNDSSEELKDLFSWIAELNLEIPLHLSRYFPAYKLNKEATSIDKMLEAYQLASEVLSYVYLGNVHMTEGHDTNCPQCGQLLIKREYYQIKNLLKDGTCPKCEEKIYGVF